MPDSFFFQAVDLQGTPIADVATILAARQAACQVSGLSCDESLMHRAHSVRFDCQGPEGLKASVSFSTDDPEWAVRVPDDDLQSSRGDPVLAAQGATVDLIQAMLVQTPPYLGTAVWPFGPAVPEIYDITAPFRIRQVGPVMYLGERYIDTQLGRSDLTDAPVWRREEVAGGILLLAYPDLLHSPDDGDLDELRRYLELAHS